MHLVQGMSTAMPSIVVKTARRGYGALYHFIQHRPCQVSSWQLTQGTLTKESFGCACSGPQTITTKLQESVLGALQQPVVPTWRHRLEECIRRLCVCLSHGACHLAATRLEPKPSSQKQKLLEAISLLGKPSH
eukprot:5812964-Amphidinium_carterae.1